MKTERAKFFSSYVEGRVEKESDAGQLEEVVFKDGAAVAKVSVGSELPLKLEKFLNAKQSIHITVPCYATEAGIKDAYEFASKFCEDHLGMKMQEYMNHLDSMGVDYTKIAEGVK